MNGQEELALSHLDSIEQKVRETEKKKKILSILSSVSMFILVTMISIYFFFFGSVKVSTMTGNRYLSEEEVYQIAQLSNSQYMLFSSPEKVKKNLEKNSYIESASIKWSLFSYSIHIQEVHPILKHLDDIILSNGEFYSHYHNEHSDYELKEDSHFITTLSPYQNTLLEKHFLHILNAWNEEEFEKMKFLEISVLSQSNPNANDVYFGIYFSMDGSIICLRANIQTWNILSFKENVLFYVKSIESHLKEETKEINGETLLYQSITAIYDSSSKSIKFYSY